MNKMHRFFTDFEALQKEAPKQIEGFVYVGKGDHKHPLYAQLNIQPILSALFSDGHFSSDGLLEGSNKKVDYYLEGSFYRTYFCNEENHLTNQF